MSRSVSTRLIDPTLLPEAALSTFRKLDPRLLARNPVIFVTWTVAVLTTILFLRDFATDGPAGFTGQIAFWLWLTVLFANFAEAVAEGRGKAQADSLRQARTQITARRLRSLDDPDPEIVLGHTLRLGDLVLVQAGEVIPGDGEVVEGLATIDESAITGESAPVIRESGGDRSAVTAATRVLSDWVKVRITAEPGSSFLDRMIALIEGAERQKTPNELALNVLIAGMTLIFLIATVTIEGFVAYAGITVPVAVLAALLVTLIPTTIGGLLSAIGIAGMDRLLRVNVVARSGRAVEAAGDVDTLLLDKTGTITIGNRMATELVPAPGVTERQLAEAALLASVADETPEGRSIVAIARDLHGLEPVDDAQTATFVPFSAQTRMSGVDRGGSEIRKGAVDAILAAASRRHPEAGALPPALAQAVDRIAKSGGTPLAVSVDGRVLGIVHLKDVVKPGVRDRFAELRRMGIRTVMITGDNSLTAAAIAAEAGVDGFLVEATPEAKLKLIREEQANGKLVAMCGDGTNDAPALAQADVGVAMNTGTQAAREAGNMVDLDSDPTKLIEVVGIGQQLLMTRGVLTTFSIANDVAKYFAILPALFVAAYPQLGLLNVMGLASPESAILSAVIFNALIIVALIPLALRGVAYRPMGAAAVLRRNLLIYGLGGVIAPFAGIKAIDLAISALHLV